VCVVAYVRGVPSSFCAVDDEGSCPGVLAVASAEEAEGDFSSLSLGSPSSEAGAEVEGNNFGSLGGGVVDSTG
jgi:hypothetical protein